MTKIYYDAEKTIVTVDKKEKNDKNEKNEKDTLTSQTVESINKKNKKDNKFVNLLTQEEINKEILKSLDDPIINELFKAIIRLIAFFCREETAFGAREIDGV